MDTWEKIELASDEVREAVSDAFGPEVVAAGSGVEVSVVACSVDYGGGDVSIFRFIGIRKDGIFMCVMPWEMSPIRTWADKDAIDRMLNELMPSGATYQA